MLGDSSKRMCAVNNTVTVFVGKALFNLLNPELNPSAQRCLTRFFTGDFSS
jgi:hypothetical protein